MILVGYGIELIRLRQDDLELVRQMRNSPAIAQRMEFRETITPEMQQQWFRSVDVPESHYYVIVSEGKKIGLINGAKIDWEKKETRSGGIFIWDEESLGTNAPLAASLLLTDTSLLLGLKHTYIKVLRDNPAAISYNRQLGYELLPGQDDAYNQEYVLTEENYRAKTATVRAYFHRRFGETITMIIDDPQHPVTQFLLDKINAVPAAQKQQLKIIYR